MQVSPQGAAMGFLFDMVTGSFPLGTTGGALLKNLLSPSPQDLDMAYDPAGAAKNADFQTGDLKGMARGLLGKLDSWLGDMEQPTTDAEAAASGRPRTDGGVLNEARQQSGLGGGLGKMLLWGGAAFVGVKLLKNIFWGCFSPPLYGPGMMMPGMMMPGMMMPGMMPGLF